MGICESVEQKNALVKTKEIERAMLDEHAAQAKIIKLLLLGRRISAPFTEVHMYVHT